MNVPICTCHQVLSEYSWLFIRYSIHDFAVSLVIKYMGRCTRLQYIFDDDVMTKNNTQIAFVYNARAYIIHYVRFQQ